MLIVFCITSIETIGDTGATCEASNLPTDGPDYMGRIQVRGGTKGLRGQGGSYQSPGY